MMKKRLKRFVFCTIALLVCFLCFAGCVYNPPKLPEGEKNDDGANLVEQDFDNAIDAYLFGEEFFNDSKNLETITYGAAVTNGTTTHVLTRTYKSQAGNDFLYETTSFTPKMLGIDPTFALKVYKQDDLDKYYYNRVNGVDKPNGASPDPEFTSDIFKGHTADFSGLAAIEVQNLETLKADVTGADPQLMHGYIINENTIKRVMSFQRDKNGYAYVFKLSLNNSAAVDHRKQVALFAEQTFKGSNPLSWADGIMIEFSMDKYGRILRVDVEDNYRITAPMVGEANVDVKSAQYIYYGKRPVINFLDNDVFVGPDITYMAKIYFDNEGGIDVDSILVNCGQEIGQLPVPTRGNDVFIGWFSQREGGGKQYTAQSICDFNSDITLYAHYESV